MTLRFKVIIYSFPYQIFRKMLSQEYILYIIHCMSNEENSFLCSSALQTEGVCPDALHAKKLCSYPGKMVHESEGNRHYVTSQVI